MHSFLRFTTLAILVALISAQPAGGNSQPRATAAVEANDSLRTDLERVAQMFDLTDTQKEQARAFFEQAEASAQSIRQASQLKLAELVSAAKAGKGKDEIQKLAQEQGRLLGELLEIRTESWAKFYRMVTPEQRAKAEQFTEELNKKTHSGQRTGQ